MRDPAAELQSARGSASNLHGPPPWWLAGRQPKTSSARGPSRSQQAPSYHDLDALVQHFDAKLEQAVSIITRVSVRSEAQVDAFETARQEHLELRRVVASLCEDVRVFQEQQSKHSDDIQLLQGSHAVLQEVQVQHGSLCVTLQGRITNGLQELNGLVKNTTQGLTADVEVLRTHCSINCSSVEALLRSKCEGVDQACDTRIQQVVQLCMEEHVSPGQRLLESDVAELRSQCHHALEELTIQSSLLIDLAALRTSQDDIASTLEALQRQLARTEASQERLQSDLGAAEKRLHEHTQSALELHGSGLLDLKRDIVDRHDVQMASLREPLEQAIEAARSQTRSNLEEVQGRMRDDLEALRAESESNMESLRNEHCSDIEALWDRCRAATDQCTASITDNVNSVREQLGTEVAALGKQHESGVDALRAQQVKLAVELRTRFKCDVEALRCDFAQSSEHSQCSEASYREHVAECCAAVEARCREHSAQGHKGADQCYRKLALSIEAVKQEYQGSVTSQEKCLEARLSKFKREFEEPKLKQRQWSFMDALQSPFACQDTGKGKLQEAETLLRSSLERYEASSSTHTPPELFEANTASADASGASGLSAPVTDIRAEQGKFADKLHQQLGALEQAQAKLVGDIAVLQGESTEHQSTVKQLCSEGRTSIEAVRQHCNERSSGIEVIQQQQHQESAAGIEELQGHCSKCNSDIEVLRTQQQHLESGQGQLFDSIGALKEQLLSDVSAQLDVANVRQEEQAGAIKAAQDLHGQQGALKEQILNDVSAQLAVVNARQEEQAGAIKAAQDLHGQQGTEISELRLGHTKQSRALEALRLGLRHQAKDIQALRAGQQGLDSGLSSSVLELRDESARLSAQIGEMVPPSFSL